MTNHFRLYLNGANLRIEINDSKDPTDMSYNTVFAQFGTTFKGK